MTVDRHAESRSVGSASEDVSRIRALIEADRIVQARAVLSEALESNPEDEELSSLQEVLKPPEGKPRQIVDPDRSMEFEWIVANRTEYRGRWVAVNGNKLVADAPSFAELLSRIRNVESVPLVHRID